MQEAVFTTIIGALGNESPQRLAYITCQTEYVDAPALWP